MTALDGNVDITQNGNRRQAILNPAVTGQQVLYLQRRRFAVVFARRLVPLTRGGRWTNGMHKSTGVIMAWLFNDLFCGPILLNLACVQHDDMIRNLRNDRKIVGHINGCSAFLFDHRLKGFEHFDLGCDIKSRSGFVQHQKIRLTA